MNILRRFAIPASALLLLALSPAADTSLHDTWFKVKVKASGYVVEPDGFVHKFGGGEPAYVHMTLDSSAAPPADGMTLPVTAYRLEIWTEATPDTWTMSYETVESVESSDGRMFFMTDMECEFHSATGAVLDAYITAMIKVTRDKSGAVTSASLASLGGEIYDGTLDGDDLVRGGISLKGKLVKGSKLPFTP